MTPVGRPFYVTGGTLPRDAACYVARAADEEIFDAIARGVFCYVLTSRQMGKSSLMVRAAARLRQAGTACGVLDLTALGRDPTQEQWYDGLLNLTGKQFGLEDELEDFWMAHLRITPLQRWLRSLDEVVLPRVNGRVALFVDEIDAVRSLPFSADEFFAAIRHCHNRQADQHEPGRLTFCLLGVATPADLIRDVRATPFNIGRRIELHDFTLAEALPLAKGMDDALRHCGPGAEGDGAGHDPAQLQSRRAARILERVLHWTGGHPYLTQRLCQAVADGIAAAGREGALALRPAGDDEVDRQCKRLFLSPGSRERDDNLVMVRDRLLRYGGDAAALLTLYGRVSRGQRVPDDETNPLVSDLKLSGVVRSHERALAVRNRVYAQEFDERWTMRSLPDAEARRQRAAFRKGAARAALVASVIIAVLVVLCVLAIDRARLAQESQRREKQASRRVQAALAAARDAAVSERRAQDRATERAKDATRAAAQARESAVRTAAQRDRATRAEEATARALWRSYLAQARALRWSGRAGRRFEALTALAAAAKLKPSVEVRNEAIASLALTDMRVERTWQAWPSGMSGTRGLGFAADLTRYARGEPGGAVSIRRVLDDRELVRLPCAGPQARNLAFSADGRLLAVDYEPGGRFILWDLGRRRRIMDVAQGLSAWTISFSPDSRRVAIAYPDLPIRVFETSSGRELARFGRGSLHSHLAFDPTGRRLALCDLAVLRIYDPRTGTAMATIPVPATTSDCSWRPDGTRVAVACSDGRVRAYDPDTQRLCMEAGGPSPMMNSVAYSPSGELLASGGWDGMMRLWDLSDGRAISAAGGKGGSVVFSANGRRLACFQDGLRVGLWEVRGGKECRIVHASSGKLEGGRTIGFSADGAVLMYAGQRAMHLWDVATGSELSRLPAARASAAVFHPSGKYLVTLTVAGLQRWRVRRGAPAGPGNCEFGTPERLSQTGCPDSPGPWRIALSDNGRTLVAPLRDGTHVVRLDRPAKDTRLPEIDPAYVAASPDGRWVATSREPDHTTGVRVWDASSAALVRRMPDCTNAAIAFSPDGRWLVTGSHSEYRFWHTGTWASAHRIARRASDLPGYMAFSPDGRMLAVLITRQIIRVVDPATAREIATLESPNPQDIGWLSFSPDSSRLAAAANCVQLWDLALLRSELKSVGLDWDLPPYPPRHDRPVTGITWEPAP